MSCMVVHFHGTQRKVMAPSELDKLSLQVITDGAQMMLASCYRSCTDDILKIMVMTQCFKSAPQQDRNFERGDVSKAFEDMCIQSEGWGNSAGNPSQNSFLIHNMCFGL